ncbi:MAG: 16S rRNA (guanine(966)-N(2))-methyltransferase RsmD, partial [Clostridia bacterium]|nr:16S rRNA (guanine(966)-N(2))-methyltransferase RsmD [Clostridia bacterium]
MRIITGKAKGIRLATLDGEATRPTSERTKEAVFSMLQFDIEGRRVLDLFAGSGQMGLEALSRGAQSATFVDHAKAAISVIKQNIEKTRLEGANVVCADSLEYLRTEGRKRNESAKFDIVFLDPPYADKIIP